MKIEYLREVYLALLIKTLTASVFDESGWNRFYTHKRFYVRFLIWLLGRFNLIFVKLNIFDYASRNNGQDWPMFGFTMTGVKRMTFLKQSIINVIEQKITGDLFDARVWRGGSSILMKAVLNAFNDNRKVILADSFEGMPKPSGIAGGFDLLDENIVFIKG